jgi:hypothetical protein
MAGSIPREVHRSTKTEKSKAIERRGRLRSLCWSAPCLLSAGGCLTVEFLLHEFPKGIFAFVLVAEFACRAAFLHFGKYSVDGPATSRTLFDLELLRELVEIFGHHGDWPSRVAYAPRR